MIYYEQSEILPKVFANPAKGFVKFIKGNAYIVGPFMRSAIVTFSSVILNVYFSSLTAYAIVAYEWKLKTVFNNIVTAFMMLPTTIATIGYYQLVWKFHMTNNIAMLIFPAIATPLTVFFMKLYLQATFSMEIGGRTLSVDIGIRIELVQSVCTFDHTHRREEQDTAAGLYTEYSDNHRPAGHHLSHLFEIHSRRRRAGKR